MPKAKRVTNLKGFINGQIKGFQESLQLGRLDDKRYIAFQKDVIDLMQELSNPKHYEEVRQYIVKKDKEFYEKATEKLPKNTIAPICLPEA